MLQKKNEGILFSAEIRVVGSYTDRLLKSTPSWNSLQARGDYLKCVLVFKCLHGTAPLYLHSQFRYAHQVHAYNTSSHDLLRPPGENGYVAKRRSVRI